MMKASSLQRPFALGFLFLSCLLLPSYAGDLQIASVYPSEINCGIDQDQAISEISEAYDQEFTKLRSDEQWTAEESCAWMRFDFSSRQRIVENLFFVRHMLKDLSIDNPYEPVVPSGLPPLSITFPDYDQYSNPSGAQDDRLKAGAESVSFWKIRSLAQWKANMLITQLAKAADWWRDNQDAYIKKCGEPQMKTSALPDGLVQGAALCMIWTSKNPATSKYRNNGGLFKPDPDAENCENYEIHPVPVLSCPKLDSPERPTATSEPTPIKSITPAKEDQTAPAKEEKQSRFVQWLSSLTGTLAALTAFIFAIVGLLAAVRGKKDSAAQSGKD
jgi:hypothetical protein